MALGVLVDRGPQKRGGPGPKARRVETLLEAQALLDRCYAVRARLVRMYWRLRNRARERGREDGRHEVLRREAERLAATELCAAGDLDSLDQAAVDLVLDVVQRVMPERMSTAGRATRDPPGRGDIGRQGDAAMNHSRLAPVAPIYAVREQCAFEELKARRAVLAERARSLARIDAELAMLRAQQDGVRHDAKAPSLGRKLDLLRLARVEDRLGVLKDRERTKVVERAAAAAGAAAAAHDFAESVRAYRTLRQDAERAYRRVRGEAPAERDLA